MSEFEPERLSEVGVLVVGDAMLDQYWFGSVDRISPEAPVPVVRIEGEEYRLGGAANVAHNVASLGSRATLLSVVGADSGADRMRALLQESGVSHDLRVDKSINTIVKLRVSGRSQQLIRIDFERPPLTESLDGLASLMESHLVTHQVVLFSDYGKGCLSQIREKIEIVRRYGLRVFIDPKGVNWDRYAGATLLTPNRSELAEVVGKWATESDLISRAQDLRRRLSLEALLVTRSEEGMTIFDDEGELSVPAQAREVFDVTGAGDTVIATMAALVGAGASIREAVVYANRAGGIVVRKFGTATVTPKELFE